MHVNKTSKTDDNCYWIIFHIIISLFFSHLFSSQIEGISLISVTLAIYGVMGPMVSTYEEKYDKFGNLHIPNELGVAYCVVPCAILAVIFHP